MGRAPLLVSGLVILVIVIVIIITIITGALRRPLDARYLVALGEHDQVFGRNWALLGPSCHSYLLGAYGTVWQVRDHAVVAITVHRYLNILPDWISAPRVVARDWPVTQPRSAH